MAQLLMASSINQKWDQNKTNDICSHANSTEIGHQERSGEVKTIIDVILVAHIACRLAYTNIGPASGMQVGSYIVYDNSFTISLIYKGTNLVFSLIMKKRYNNTMTTFWAFSLPPRQVFNLNILLQL